MKIDISTQAAAIGDAIGDFLALEARGWKGRAGTAAAGSEAIRCFIEEAVTGLAAEDKARIDRLRIAGKAIAAIVTLRSGDTAWTWKIAYDEDFARYSPGVQIMLEVTEALLTDATMARANSCADPDHPMIDHLWRERLALADRLIAVRPLRLAFPWVCRLETLRRRSADRRRSACATGCASTEHGVRLRGRRWMTGWNVRGRQSALPRTCRVHGSAHPDAKGWMAAAPEASRPARQRRAEGT